ncbi:MAG: TIM barrel protein [Victivallales bacterium]|nr:TIM barrel protein [Victivallales bacterium]
MKLTPCLELFFRDLPFEERFAAVADCGYSAGEFWGLGDRNPDAIRKAAASHGMIITSFTSHLSGLTDEKNHEAAIEGFKKDIEDAKRLNCKNVIALSGNFIPGKTRCQLTKNVIEALKRAAPLAEAAGITIVLELLNSAVNHPNYYIDNSEDMAAVLRAVNSPNVKGLYDIYHAGIMEGNVTEKILTNLDIIGHFHAAGIPGRHEMTGGEQNYPFICKKIDEAGFQGYLGLEYIPLKPSKESLVETREWLA